MEYNNQPDAITLGQIIKEYRVEQGLSREELAWRLEVDEKALLNWERGQVAVIRFANRKKLHEVLGIPLKILSLGDHVTSEGALKLHKRIHSFLERGAYRSVLETSDLLIQGCTVPGNRVDERMRSILAHAFYTKGLATAALTNEPRQALQLYKQMEPVADKLDDTTGLDIARTYQGDMYRRLRDYDKAQSLLEGVIDQFKGVRLSGMKALVAGNCQQLLARVHLAKNEKEETLDALKRAEELAYLAIPQQERDWYICFCLCSVKEELAKSLMLLRRYRKSFDVLEEVKRLSLDAPPRWAIPSAITQGELLVRFARQTDDRSLYEEGIESLSKGYKLAKEHNHLRQQQRISRLLTRWNDSDGFRLESSQKLWGEMRKTGGERSEE
jgi:transcriptional regulator with XRE-family HTH domain